MSVVQWIDVVASISEHAYPGALVHRWTEVDLVLRVTRSVDSDDQTDDALASVQQRLFPRLRLKHCRWSYYASFRSSPPLYNIDTYPGCDYGVTFELD